MARYIIFGAGAVGGLIGARLHGAGQDVTLIARGAHLEAMARNGLTVRTPNGSEVVRVPVTGTLADVSIGADDTVILAMKTQDAAPILDQLAAVAHPGAATICAQNGIEGERMASRFFANVYGAYVYCNAVQLDPGEVRSYTGDCFAILDIGRYPSGNDARGAAITADLEAAGFSSRPSHDIMYWKRAKLVLNTSNASNAACADRQQAKAIVAATIDEARRCMAAAGLAFASNEEVAERAKTLAPGKIDGEGSPGSSTYQSLFRGNPTTEADYLNGEIALLGRQLGIATPANAAMQALIRRMARDHAPPRSISAEEIHRLIAAAGSPS